MISIKHAWTVEESCRCCGEENITLIYEKRPSNKKITRDFDLPNGDDMEYLCFTCKKVENAIHDVRKEKRRKNEQL